MPGNGAVRADRWALGKTGKAWEISRLRRWPGVASSPLAGAFPSQACRSCDTGEMGARTPVALRGVSPSIPQCGPHHERTGALPEPRSAGGVNHEVGKSGPGLACRQRFTTAVLQGSSRLKLGGVETSRLAGWSGRFDVEVLGLVPSSLARPLPASPDTCEALLLLLLGTTGGPPSADKRQALVVPWRAGPSSYPQPIGVKSIERMALGRLPPSKGPESRK